jgi:GNAT superfamily N-acetyltransferase
MRRIQELAMSIKIRSPRDGDEIQLAELCGEMGYPSSPSEVAQRLVALSGRDDHTVFVATDTHDHPICLAHVHLSYRIVADSFAELGAFVVSGEYRGEGIGERLLAEAERWGREKGGGLFRVRSNAKRERAHRFYLRAGYAQAKTSYVFDKSL